MRFVFETPDILEQILPGAEPIMLPENNPELYKVKQETLQALKRQGKSCTLVHIRRPERVPPHIEAAAERS
jgi:hypothetical protein